MPDSVPLRRDFDARHLRKTRPAVARDARQSRRLLASGRGLRWHEQQDGCVARIGGDRICQIIRDWVLRFNARGTGRAGRWEGHRAARARSSTPITSRKHLAEVVEAGPGPGGRRRRALAAQGPEARWLLETLWRHLARRDHGRDIADCLKANSASPRSAARPQPLPAQETSWIVEAFKKTSPTRTPGEDPG